VEMEVLVEVELVDIEVDVLDEVELVEVVVAPAGERGLTSKKSVAI